MAIDRRDVTFGLLATALVPQRAAARGLSSVAGRAFGTGWRVVADAGADLAGLQPRIAAILARIDAQMSPFRAGTALSRFNRADSTWSIAVPPALLDLTRTALGIARLTGGAFDPTVGPLVHRFGFGPIRGAPGHHGQLTAGPDGLRKAHPGLTLDLCGIAKGHAVDEVIAALAAARVRHALVDIGGEVRCIGAHPEGRPWRVAISAPDGRVDGAAQDTAQRIVAPGALALATSGHAVNGMRAPISISHIIDPRSARPAATEIASVSVLASTAARADALATALCALGEGPGVALARDLGIAALFVRPDASDTATGAFARHIVT